MCSFGECYDNIFCGMRGGIDDGTGKLAIRFFEFFENLTDMMEHLEHHVSYLSKYAPSMFQDSEDI